MSGLSWIILNIILIGGALYGTMKVRSAPPPKPLQLEEAVTSASTDAPQHKATSHTGENATPSRALASTSSLDDLWKQTLFLPTRTEDTGEDAAEQAAAEQAAFAARNIEFELVGIAQINVMDAEAVPVAILRSKVGAIASQRGSRRSPPPRGGRNNAVPTPTEPNKNEEQQVFRVGEKINQTGYVLTSIDPDASMVEVTRNGETVKLYINFAGAEAMQRREAVTQETTRRHQEQQRRIEQENVARQQAQAQQDQQTATTPNPGAPPGPPGTPGTPGSDVAGGTPNNATPPNSPDARAERLRRIAEARQARQARQQQQQHHPSRGSEPANDAPNNAPPSTNGQQ